MEKLYELMYEFNKKNINTYFIGSYVYNKLIKNISYYEDIDIVSQDIDRFESELKKHFNCITEKAGIGEHGESTFTKLKCDGFNKRIDLIDEIYAKYNIGMNRRNKQLYDFQRITYNGTPSGFFSFDDKMDVKQTISDYKNNKVCYNPPNLRDKDKERLSYLKKANMLDCLMRDFGKYSYDEMKEFYFTKN